MEPLVSTTPEPQSQAMQAGGEPAGARGADRSPVRCLLCLAIAVILALTLTPAKDWEGAKEHVLCVFCEGFLPDALNNLILFLPLGMALRLCGSTMARTLLVGALLSFGIETTQCVIPGRDPNLGDFLFNVCGAALGSALSRTALGPALERIFSRCARVLARPEARLTDHLALAAALVVTAVFGLTGLLLAPAFPQGTYFGGTNILQTTSTPLRLGGNTYPKEYFQGLIDNVRIYHRPLTASEIQADMARPVPARAPSPPPAADLVAAYSFDAGMGTTVADASGRGNTGTLSGSTWTRTGKFGGALAFDGVKDVVTVPHAAALDLTTGMTLEAWVYPSAAQSGWRAVVQKEVDAYFLHAGSDAGALRPAGGGTFGGLIDSIKAPTAIPVKAWTHLALTYDGATLRLYVNGSQVASRPRWSRGRVLDASVGGLKVHSGPLLHSPELRQRLLAGAPVQVQALAGPPVPALVPLLSLQDEDQRDIVFLGPEQDDLVFRFHSRADALGLNAPEHRIAGALRGLAPGDALAITVSHDRHGYCLDVNGTSTCGLGFTVGMGWALFLYSPALPAWLHAVLNGIWIAALAFPVGFWARRRWGSCAAGVVLAMDLLLLPQTTGLLASPLAQMGAAVSGFVVGWGWRSRLHGRS